VVETGKESPTVTDISAFAELVALDHGLCVFNTLRGDGSIQASVVNAGVLPHPLTGAPVVGLVAAGGARKLHNLRADPRATIVARAGWQWAAVEGTAEVVGPDDPHPDVDAETLRLWLRDIFRSAGGTHDDWDTFDRVMAEERRAAVLLAPGRTYTNPKTS
jgi:PPOX class probable F420-dependent enzyme